MTTVPLRHMATVWTSSVDKHTVDGELPVQLCNYTDAYKNDRVRPGPKLMRATATPEEVQRNRLRVGDTVFTKDSEDPQDIGISAYIDGEADDFVCGYHLAIARPAESTHPRFLTWSLRSRPVLDHFGNHASGISRYGISLAGLRSAPIPLWATGDQRRIADFLDDRVSRIDRIIAARWKQIEVGRALEQSVLSQTLLHADDELAALRRLGVTVTTGPFGTVFSAAEYVDDGIPMINPTHIQRGVITPDPHHGVSPGTALRLVRHRLRAGDLVVSRKGDIGRTAMIQSEQDGWICGSDSIALHATSPCIISELLDQLLKLDFTRHQLLAQSYAATMPSLTEGNLLSLRVPVLPMEEQRERAAAAQAVHTSAGDMITSVSRSIDLLAEYKTSLITDAVTGELDVSTAGSSIPG